jgi:uncharacterized protein (TIGR02246 family)
VAEAVSLTADDRLAVLDLVTRADDAASRRDADAYVALFSEDAVLDGSQGVHAGREELRASVGPIWAAEGAATLHLTLNPVVEPGTDDDHAVVRSVMLILDAEETPGIRSAVLIRQELRRTDGSWLISRRTVAPAMGAR